MCRGGASGAVGYGPTAVVVFSLGDAVGDFLGDDFGFAGILSNAGEKN